MLFVYIRCTVCFLAKFSVQVFSSLLEFKYCVYSCFVFIAEFKIEMCMIKIFIKILQSIMRSANI
jgi:hypothetical protein